MSDTALQESVTAQLERMLSRPPLASSPTLSRLFRFLVEETMAGRSAEITEYNLGVRIFHRSADFNPRVDPIVRVQTHYLRAKLAQYYAGPGADDPIVIELPARTYVPRLPKPEPVALAEPAAAETPAAEQAAPSRRGWAAGLGMLVVAVAAIGLLSGSGQGRGAQHDPDPAAQDLYSQGRYLLDRQTEAALRQSVDCFGRPQSAMRGSPLRTPASPMRSMCWCSMATCRRVRGWRRRGAAAQHALALDSHLAEGYVALAAISEAYDWNFKKAETEYRRAIELNPELPAAHAWYGMFLRDQGRLKEALPELRRAEQLEPMSVLATINLSYALHMVGNNDAAVEMAHRAEELNPELAIPDVLLANIYRAHSDIGDAEASLTHARSLAEGNPHALSALVCLYARLGRRDESASILREMEEMATQRYVSPFDLGNAALSLGDEDRAANWFEQAYRERSTGMIFLCRERSDSMIKSPRLRELVQKIGRG
ncbi:MAG: tetratricopeptide repeat protein [Ignavibacteriota bacterium]